VIGPAIDVDTGPVRLTAESFRIVTAWHEYTMAGITTKGTPLDYFACDYEADDCISAHSAGTLELIWCEAGEQQRLFIYLDSDETTWWATEVRTYDGRPDRNEDWLSWHGRFFETPLGQPWQGDLHLTDGKGAHHLSDGLTPTGELHIEGMTLEAFTGASDPSMSPAQLRSDAYARKMEKNAARRHTCE
jgi:hypothetical protein